MGKLLSLKLFLSLTIYYKTIFSDADKAEQHVQEATAGMAKAAEDLASLEQRLLEKIDSQQKTIDMLVGIVSKFDVTADLERL